MTITPNRVAALSAFFTGLAGAVAGLAGAFPNNTQNTVLTVSGGLGAIATCLHFMLGSQKWENLNVQKEMQAAHIELEKLIQNPKEIPAAASDLINRISEIEKFITDLKLGNIGQAEAKADPAPIPISDDLPHNPIPTA